MAVHMGCSISLSKPPFAPLRFSSETFGPMQEPFSSITLNLNFSFRGSQRTERCRLRFRFLEFLIDSESPMSFRALDDHIEVKLVLLLPVDHPIVSSFDSVLLDSSENGNDSVAFDAAKQLAMDTDLKSLSSIEGGVHLYCRNCANRLTKDPLRNFVEMPSIDWRELADNWFGACCCSFGGISGKLVTRFANSYTCAKGVCLLNSTIVLLCKDDLMLCELYNGTRGYQPGLDFASDYGSSEDVLSCQKRTDDLCGKLRSMNLINDIVSTHVPVTEETNVLSALAVPKFSENETLVSSCCVHMADHLHNHVSETCPVDENTSMLLANPKLFLNGFLGNAFMAKSYNLSMGIEWRDFVCPKCLSLLGTCPFDNGGATIDDGV